MLYSRNNYAFAIYFEVTVSKIKVTSKMVSGQITLEQINPKTHTL